MPALAVLHPHERLPADRPGPGPHPRPLHPAGRRRSRHRLRAGFLHRSHGPDGGRERARVVAVDIHPGMLERTRKRAARAGVSRTASRLHLADKDRLGLDCLRADFALAFWMAHEVPDPGRLFAGIRAALKPEGRLLLVEPRMHVAEVCFRGPRRGRRRRGFRSRGRGTDPPQPGGRSPPNRRRRPPVRAG
ncbi:MAG: class I SAM-dependent methyltransferase [Sphingobacterium sp.]|nr:class I SAM-dependent methyltransferase [Sphingobacterium sp.]